MSRAAAAPPPPAPDRPDVAAFGEALDAFLRAHRRAVGRFAAHPRVPELSSSQFHVVEPLDRLGRACTVGELAAEAGVSAPTATRMLDGLAERGIVDRARCTEDRRVVKITLTATGRELVARKRAAALAAREAVFDRLPAGQRKAAAKLLLGLADAVEELHP